MSSSTRGRQTLDGKGPPETKEKEQTAMPTRTTPPHGAPCWVDLTTSNADASRRFYTELLGWEAQEQDPDHGGYFLFTLRGAPIAGCMPATPDMPVKDIWQTHLATTDVNKTLELAASKGGHVAFGPHQVSDLGYMSMVIDPSGASIGAWQPITFNGFGILFEPGAPCWHELHTNNYDTVVPFYREVFEWETSTMSDDPTFRYTTLKGNGDTMLAGVFDAAQSLPEGSGSHWVVYFGADPDEGCQTVERLGGKVLEAPVDTPYGRMATVRDSNGTPFKIMRGNGTPPETLD
jgi:predicted enzyme related to lactoylglutathione lyase